LLFICLFLIYKQLELFIYWLKYIILFHSIDDEIDLEGSEGIENCLTCKFVITFLNVSKFYYWTYVHLLCFYRVKMRMVHKMRKELWIVQSIFDVKFISFPYMGTCFFIQCCIESLHLPRVVVCHLMRSKKYRNGILLFI